MNKSYEALWKPLSGDVALFVPMVTDVFLEQVPQVETWRRNEVSLVTREEERILGRGNSTHDGPEIRKSLMNVQTWKATLDKGFAKSDIRPIWRSGQGPVSVAWLGGMSWPSGCVQGAIAGLEGGEWPSQMYSLKQSHWLLSGSFIKAYHVPSTVSCARDTTVRILPPWRTSQPTGKIRY